MEGLQDGYLDGALGYDIDDSGVQCKNKERQKKRVSYMSLGRGFREREGLVLFERIYQGEGEMRVGVEGTERGCGCGCRDRI